MRVLKGTGVSKGIAIGPLHFVTQKELNVEKLPISNVGEEVARFENARAIAILQLGQIADKTEERLGAENSLLFRIHQMMLEDLDYHDTVVSHIEDNLVCAEYAVNETAKEFAQMFAEMDDEYMQARETDVHDISRRVIELLLGVQSEQCTEGAPSILSAVDFTPSETATFDRETVLGLVTSQGSKNSHTAIFARTLSIPAVIGLGDQLSESDEGKLIVIDGEMGEVVLEPSDDVLKEMKEKKQALEDERQKLQAFVGRKTLTKQGREVKLYANIGAVADVNAVLENDAEGIGLFRSEFLYLESKDFPSEETQLKAYQTVAEKMDGKPVIIRTLDIGADKQADYFNLPAEENPAMGLRALRICLTQPKIFKTQLRALYRASAYGNIYIMLPMVASLFEIKQAKNIIEEVKQELRDENVPFHADVPLGIMIETPAAALISDILAKEVDFFSIGTNDLTQYTLAVDRQNESLDDFCNTHHEAVLRLIEMTAKNAHDNGIWVGICGELGADTELYEFFEKVGIDELSVIPSAILPCRKTLSMT